MAAKWSGAGKERPVVGVMGVGYVGLPLALHFVRGGCRTLGFDVDPQKAAALNEGRSYIKYIPDEEIAAARAGGLLEGTTDFVRVAETDACLICVPTPLDRRRQPDLRYVVATAEALGPHLRAGQLVVLESTTYPGTTEEVLRPVLEKASGLRAGEDFLLAYSPEREDPGNRKYKTADIPKVVGGLNEESLTAARELYDRAVRRTVPVRSLRTAEACKLLENIFRCVNIAMANELKTVFERMGLDVWEVIEAAATKPFGFMPFYPGPGLGGHCIPIDPFYLSWKAREYGAMTRFIELAGEINRAMPEYVLGRLQTELSDRGRALKDAVVLLLGLAYKKDVDDARESPTYALWELLEARGAKVLYHDPFIPEVPPSREHADLAGRKSVLLTPETLASCAAVVVVTDHSEVDYEAVVRYAPLVVDTRNVCAKVERALCEGKVVRA